MQSRSADAGALAAGTTMAGMLVGAGEALHRQAPIAFSMALYAALWAVLGAALGVVATAVWKSKLHGRPLASLGAAAAAGLSSTALVRFALFRDVFAEAPEHARSATLGALVAGTCIACLFFGVVRGLTHLLRWRKHGSVSWAVPVAACAVFACMTALGPAEQAAPVLQAAAHRDTQGVILVVADALRADSVGAYGAGPHRDAPATPTLDALATRGHLFVDASAQASWTKPAMASLMTSRLPSGHNTMAKAAMLPRTLPTLASVLSRRGVHTGAVVTNYNLDAGFGFDQGFEAFAYLAPKRYLGAPEGAHRLAAYNVYRLLRERFFTAGRDSRYFYRSGADVNQTALALVDRFAGKRFFLWLHYMEAHDPYVDTEGSSWARVSDPHPPQAAAAAMRRAYQDGVRRFDTALGDLLEALRQRGLDQQLTVVVTADHGEEFGDHGGFYHGTTLYEEMLHVPLIVQGPQVKPGVARTLARQIDVAPTILSLWGIAPPQSWEGMPLMGQDVPAEALAEEDHEGNVLSAVQVRHSDGSVLKLVRANPTNPRGLPPHALFDLSLDPMERTPLPVHDERHGRLQARLEAGLARARQGAGRSQAQVLDTGAEADLRALGYVQ